MTDRLNRFVQIGMTHQALGEPQFIVQSGAVYYLTLAVLAYDPATEGLSRAQEERVQRIKDLFQQLRNEGFGRDAVEIPELQTVAFSAGHTAPG